MIYTKPDFYDDFRCKAAECTDTCCAGWEIDIDAESLDKYKNICGEFGKRLNDNIIVNDGVAEFALKADDKCPFLNTNGLCDIYSELGEEFLCEICCEHPRFYDFFDGITEMGLGLCCEKTCELLLSDSPLNFVSYSNGENEELNEEDEIYFKIRKNCFEIVGNRELPLKDRISVLLEYAVDVQNNCFADSYKLKKLNADQLLCDIIDIFSKTEPIDAQWSDFVSGVKDKLACAENVIINENEYERILIYIIYRHFMNSRFTGNVIAPVAFAVVSLCFIYICDSVSPCDKINNIKLWSKQIEYSEFNTDFLLQKAFELFVI